MFIQYVKAPFTLPFDIFNYVESFALGLVSSGDYIVGPYALDDFSANQTGIVYFVSGSGYWLASGSFRDISTYLHDNFSNYVTGENRQFNFLTGGILHQNYRNASGLQTGFVNNSDNYLYDMFTGMTTGNYTGNFLTGNFVKENYNKYAFSKTGNTRAYLSTTHPNSGSLTGTWTITNLANVSNDGPFIGSKSYFAERESYAHFQYDDSFLLGDFTVEMWLKAEKTGAAFDTMVSTQDAPTSGFEMHFGWVPAYPYFNVWYKARFGAYTIHSTGLAFGPSEWVHFALVRNTGNNTIYNSGQEFLYYSGVLVNTLTGFGSMFASTGRLSSDRPIMIGRNETNDASGPTGNFTEFRLWNYARPASEILATYNQKIDINNPSTTGLLVYFSL